jgi:S1-C subfamily serine protease
VIKVRSPLLGAKVANLSPAVAEELRLDYSTEGVVVTDVENGSVAQRAGPGNLDRTIGGVSA